MTMKQVQNLLQYLGFYDGIPDDSYSPKTRDAVFAFQTAYGTIGVDGIPGPEVEKALKDAVAYGMPVYETEEEPDSDDFWAGIKYFKREEFRCKCGGKYCDGFPVEPDRGLVLALDKFRERLGVPVSIGGIRCPQHNKNVGGAAASQHLYGLAADCHSSKSPEEMRRVAEEVLQGTGGLGIYTWGIHFDKRAGKSRWDSR
jgi:hypothetical protein